MMPSIYVMGGKKIDNYKVMSQRKPQRGRNENNPIKSNSKN
jgi:hypothetical protein